MRVVPEKTERSAHQRAAKYGELRHARDVSNLKIGRPAVIAADVGEHRQPSGRNYGTADRETIQTIGQVDRVRRSSNDDGHKNQKRNERQRPQMWRSQERMNHQVGMDFLQEGNNQFGGIRAASSQRKQSGADDETHQNLQQELFLAGEPQI